MSNSKERVKLSKVIQKMNLINLTPEIDASGIWLNLPDVNRPALQMAGYFEHFEQLEMLVAVVFVQHFLIPVVVHCLQLLYLDFFPSY